MLKTVSEREVLVAVKGLQTTLVSKTILCCRPAKATSAALEPKGAMECLLVWDLLVCTVSLLRLLMVIQLWNRETSLLKVVIITAAAASIALIAWTSATLVAAPVVILCTATLVHFHLMRHHGELRALVDRIKAPHLDILPIKVDAWETILSCATIRRKVHIARLLRLVPVSLVVRGDDLHPTSNLLQSLRPLTI